MRISCLVLGHSPQWGAYWPLVNCMHCGMVAEPQRHVWIPRSLRFGWMDPAEEHVKELRDRLKKDLGAAGYLA